MNVSRKGKSKSLSILGGKWKSLTSFNGNMVIFPHPVEIPLSAEQKCKSLSRVYYPSFVSPQKMISISNEPPLLKYFSLNKKKKKLSKKLRFLNSIQLFEVIKEGSSFILDNDGDRSFERSCIEHETRLKTDVPSEFQMTWPMKIYLVGQTNSLNDPSPSPTYLPSSYPTSSSLKKERKRRRRKSLRK